VIKARQWSQLGIVSKVMLLLAGNVLFYLGLFGVLQDGVRLGLYTGLYIIVSLILAMSRRVIPFFIEKGVDYPVRLTNRRWLDIASLVLVLLFVLVEVFVSRPQLAALLAAALFVLHAARMAGWHTPGIWRKPLLWSIYLAYGWIALGFALIALSHVLRLSPMPAIHAFAYGGIGLMTLGMMCRVALGHTGRNVFDSPHILPVVFAALLIGAVLRVFMPMLVPHVYALWIGLAQVLWMLGFAVFLWVYVPILIGPDIKSPPGAP
jgi:uncharacterized protein involved in response to NO